MSYQLVPPTPTSRRGRGVGLYAKLRADHRALLGKIYAFDRTRTAQSAHVLLRHVVEHLPAHAALEEASGVPGCNCDEHPVFHRIAVDGLRQNTVSAALALSPMLRRHIATEEQAWRQAERAVPPMIPLGQPLLLPVPKTDPMKAMMTGLLIVVLFIAFLWWIDQKNQKPVTENRSRASKQSTKEMANSLYKRLENRGGANPGTLRSLKALGRNR